MPDKKPRRIKRSASAITRIFGHFMSIEGNAGYKEGTWIVGLLFLESAPELSALKKVFTERLLKMYRFKSRLVTSKYGGYWEEIFDEEFDWKYHLNVALENEKPTLERAQEFIGNIYEQGFDINKPLWRFFLVPEMENGNALLITMFNHAIGDGVASVGVLLQMLDDPPMDPNLPAHLQKNFIPAKRSKKPNVPLLSRIGMFFFGIKEGLLGPLGYIDPVNALKPIQDVRPRGFEKVLALSEQVPIEKFKEIKNKFEGATINDILLTVLSMTMKAYMIEIDDPSLKRKTLFGGQASPLRGNFPVSLRNPKKPILTNGSPNNEWNSISFRFPYNYTSGVDAVFKVKEQLDKDKVSPQVWVSKWNATFVLRTLPRKFVSNILLRYNARVTAMLSNVPGPTSEVHIAGKAIKDLMFFLFSPLNVYLGLITYNGKVSLGINFSKNLERDPNQFAKHWTEQFNLLYDEVMSYDGVIPKDPKKRKKKEMVSV